MNTILIIGIIQALFLGLLVVNKKNKVQADYVLIWMLIYMALHQAFFLSNFNEEISVPLPLMIIGGGFPLLYGPLILWYVLALIRENGLTTLALLIHSLPFILFVVFFTYFHYRVEGSQVMVYDGFLHIRGEYPTVMRLYTIYFAISGGAYPLASLIFLQLHKSNIHRQFSYEESIDLKWLKLIILATLISFVLGFFSIMFIVSWKLNENPKMAFYIISTINTIVIFLMGYFGLNQTTIFSPYLTTTYQSPEPENNTDSERYAKSGLDSNRSKELFLRLDKSMKKDKLYLNGKLKLIDLASLLNASTNHLSQAINENRQQNFFDYVNGFRVDAVKKLMKDPQYNHLTLLGIGLECGFNSKSAFNQIFKEVVGITPSEYKKSLRIDS